MNIYLRHVKQFGFKVSSMFCDSKWSEHYYRKDTSNNTITIVSNQTQQYVAQYQLTPEQMWAFNRGALGITPLGCCNASGGKTIEEPPQTIIQRDIKDIKDLTAILAVLGVEKELVTA